MKPMKPSWGPLLGVELSKKDLTQALLPLASLILILILRLQDGEGEEEEDMAPDYSQEDSTSKAYKDAYKLRFP